MKKGVLCAIIMVVLLLVPALSIANSKEKIVKLKPMVVTAKGEKRLKLRFPAALESLTPKSFKVMNTLEAEDFFRYLPDLYVRKIYPGSTNMPLVIRGNSTYQTARSLVLMDDVPLTNLLGAGHSYAPRWQMVSPEEIERIDVMYGPFSALYSGNSIGGVAYIKTRLPEKREIHFDVNYIYQPFREFRTNKDLNNFSFHFSYGDKLFDKLHFFLLYDRYDLETQPIMFATVYKDKGGAPVGRPVTGWESDTSCDNRPIYVVGAYSKSDIKNNFFKLKLAYDINDFTQLEFDWGYWDHEQDYTDPNTYLRDMNGNPVWSGKFDILGKSYKLSPSKLYYRETEGEDYLYVFHFRRNPKDGISINATASYYDINKDLSKKSTTSPPASKDGGPGRIDDKSSGWCTFNLKLGYKYSSPFLRTHNLTLGYYYERVFTDTESWNASDWKEDIRTSLSLFSEGKTDTHAIFFQDLWDITEKWSLYLGGRYEMWRGFDANKARDIGGKRVWVHLGTKHREYFSPKFGIIYRAYKDLSLRLSLAKTYRFPTVGEMYQGGIDSSGYLIKSNPNLNPEEVYSVDLTAIKMIEDEGKIRLSWFFNWEKNTIFQQQNIYTMVKNFQNIDRVRKIGVELSMEKRNFLINRLNGMLNISYIDATIEKDSNLPDAEGSDFPRVPHWLIKSVLSYSPIERLTLSIAQRYASKQYSTLTNTDRRKGYGCVEDYLVFDFKGSYKINDHLTASFGINNFTDTLYHVYHPYPRRTFYFSLKTTF